MTGTRITRAVFGCLIIACGIIWSIMFPKTREIFRPDFVLSVALGIGLFVTGVLCFFIKRSRVVVLLLSIMLLWSALTNVFFLAQLQSLREIVLDIPSMETRTAQYWLSILESDREDKIEYLSSRLKQGIKHSREMSAAIER
jgi:predicted acyltransferase